MPLVCREDLIDYITLRFCMSAYFSDIGQERMPREPTYLVNTVPSMKRAYLNYTDDGNGSAIIKELVTNPTSNLS